MRCVKSRINRDYEDRYFWNKFEDATESLASKVMYLGGGGGGAISCDNTINTNQEKVNPKQLC
jgi:hypothetical protein